MNLEECFSLLYPEEASPAFADWYVLPQRETDKAEREQAPPYWHANAEHEERRWIVCQVVKDQGTVKCRLRSTTSNWGFPHAKHPPEHGCRIDLNGRILKFYIFLSEKSFTPIRRTCHEVEPEVLRWLRLDPGSNAPAGEPE